MRISDWSSDVCSSDLVQESARRDPRGIRAGVRSRRTQQPPLHRVRGRRTKQRDARPDHCRTARRERAGTKVFLARLPRHETIQGSVPTCRDRKSTRELQSLMRNSYAVFCLKKKKKQQEKNTHNRDLIKQKLTNSQKSESHIHDNKYTSTHTRIIRSTVQRTILTRSLTITHDKPSTQSTTRQFKQLIYQ